MLFWVAVPRQGFQTKALRKLKQNESSALPPAERGRTLEGPLNRSRRVRKDWPDEDTEGGGAFPQRDQSWPAGKWEQMGKDEEGHGKGAASWGGKRLQHGEDFRLASHTGTVAG